MKVPLKTNIARDYRDKYGIDVPTTKLARIMLRENPLVFNDAEDARYQLRYIENKAGKRNANKKKVAVHHPDPRSTNPYNLPPSGEREYLPYVIKGFRRILILSDIHLPYHNIEALTAAITYGKKLKPDAILLNGDIMDCHELSSYEKNPTARNFPEELKVFGEFMAVLRKQFPVAKIIYKIGNHEERYHHFLQRKAHELIGVDEFDFGNIIRKRAPGVTVIDEQRVIKMGNLFGIHGHEFKGGISAPVNPARGLFMRAKVSCFQGHNHQTSEHTEPTLSGQMITTFSIGCLSELHPQYMPLNKWNHGFAFVEFSEDGRTWHFQNKRIKNGVVL